MTSVQSALVATLALFAVAPSVACCAPKASPGTAAKIAALKELRASGVITPEQYAQRAAELQVSASARISSAAAAPSFGGGRRTHAIEDPQLGMVAQQVTTPAGWRFEGSTAHGQGCSRPPDTISFRAGSSDGVYGILADGGYKYGMTNNPQVNAQMRQQGCILFSSTVADFLKDVWVPNMRPGAQIEEAGPMPDDDPLLRTVRTGNHMFVPPPTPGYQVQNSITGGIVKLRYVKDGRPVEEKLRAIAFCSDTRMQNPMGGPLTEQLDCTVPQLIAMETSNGRVDAFEAEVQHIVAIIPNPAYDQRINQIIAQRGQIIAQRGQAALAQTQAGIDAQRNAQIAQGQTALDNIHRTGAAIMNNERASANALHQQSQAFARSVGDQAQFSDTSGQTFNGSNQYSHTYVDGNGHVLQTNSAYPPGAGWTETQGH